MPKITRHHVFETNSSSSHSITFEPITCWDDIPNVTSMIKPESIESRKKTGFMIDLTLTDYYEHGENLSDAFDKIKFVFGVLLEYWFPYDLRNRDTFNVVPISITSQDPKCQNSIEEYNKKYNLIISAIKKYLPVNKISIKTPQSIADFGTECFVSYDGIKELLEENDVDKLADFIYCNKSIIHVSRDG